MSRAPTIPARASIAVQYQNSDLTLAHVNIARLTSYGGTSAARAQESRQQKQCERTEKNNAKQTNHNGDQSHTHAHAHTDKRRARFVTNLTPV